MSERILVYGVTGSGKTTLASAIAAKTGIPWHEVDELTWEPGWLPVPTEEQRARIEAICSGDRWVLDTAYSAWVDVPLRRAELIVALDYPRWRSLTMLLRRTLLRAIDHRKVCNGNTESLRQAFGGDSIIVWHFRSFSRKRARIRAWEAAAADPSRSPASSAPALVRLRSTRATRDWLDRLNRR